MRLIDADTLIEKCGNWYVEEGTESGFIGTLKNLLVIQPTVQPNLQPTYNQLATDTISRQAAIEAVMECYDNDELFEVYEEKLRELPPAQPERIKGRWISADAIFGGEPFYCSECGENTRDTVMGKPRWNFCPNCGADMRGEQDE